MTKIFQTSLQALELYNFRNHNIIKLSDLTPESVVITGKNGAGKTNILEAISLLTQSKGLRAARISELNNQSNPNALWQITAQIQSNYGLKEISTKRIVKQNTNTDTRSVHIDGMPIKKKSELSEIIKVIWLTPPMQQLFINSSSERRAFFDQIVSNFFPEHSSFLNKYEQATRERLKLLKNQVKDDYWLAAIEQNMFNAAGEISDARMKTAAILNKSIQTNNSPFPKGIVELVNEPIPADFLAQQKRNRALDAASGRTNLGPHLFDLKVIYETKNMAAKFCSTGEQKALLLNIILAQAQAIIETYKTIPILLFDEIISHLDNTNRALLFEQISALGAQSWLTGLEAKSFDLIKDKVRFIKIEQ
jgi:DNA replication and repair protein RecF